MLPKRQANRDYLSVSDIEILEDCIARYGSISFAELEAVSYRDCGKIARENSEIFLIETVGIVRDGGANGKLIEYINGMIEFDELMI